MSHLSGVYRQRSYDNLQNGKSPYRKSIKSLHLPPSYGGMNYPNYPTNHGNNLSNNINGGSNGSIVNYAQLSPIMHFQAKHQQQHHHLNQIPGNVKYFAPQSKYQGGGYDSNSLPRYPYHKNRAVPSIHPSIHQQNFCQQNFNQDHLQNNYKYPIVRHPSTPPPPPPVKRSSMMLEEQGLLVTTPTSSSSSNDCSNSEFSELDQMLPAQVKRGFEHIPHIPHYRTCKKQLQQATQMLNNQQQYYIDNYMQQYNQSPYRRYLNASASHMNVQNPPNFNQNKRLSNVYEYQLTNFDLKSIHEDPPNDT